MILEGKGLHKVYSVGKKELHVLKGIDLKIETGKIVSIVGPSGAGKSTLLHLLGGLDRPSQGEVFLRGVNIYKLKPEQRAAIRNRRIGFIFQFYHLLPEFTAVENVLLPGLISVHRSPKRGLIASVALRCSRAYRQETSKIPSAALGEPLGFGPRTTRFFKIDKETSLRERAYKLLESVGLKNRMNHKPGELSGGEQQRVAIARALINEPDVLLCDEPTGNLDSQKGEEICELLWRLNKERNQTLVIVTHEERITRGSDKVVHIQDGHLQGEG